MKTVFQRFQQYALLRAVAYVILGVLVVINPDAVFKMLTYIIAGYFAIMGVLSMYSSYRVRREAFVSDFGFMSGVLSVLFALIIILFGKSIISILPVFLGILTVLFGVFRVLQSLDAKKLNERYWMAMLAFSLIMIVAGVILVINPFSSVMLLFQAFGVLLVFMGISEIFTYFNFRNSNII